MIAFAALCFRARQTVLPEPRATRASPWLSSPRRRATSWFSPCPRQCPMSDL